jgi:hypothetical protein
MTRRVERVEVSEKFFVVSVPSSGNRNDVKESVRAVIERGTPAPAPEAAPAPTAAPAKGAKKA